MIDIRLGDCLEVMKTIPNKSIDMILCDLPYGVTANKNDIALPFDKLWDCYNRIIKDDGVICLFAQGKFYVELVYSNLSMFKYDLVWDKVLKTGFLNAKKMPLRQHEQIAIFYKNTSTHNPQFTEGKPSHDKGNLAFVRDITNNNYGKFKSVETSKSSTDKYPSSILKFSKPSPATSIHRTQKLVDLLEYLIKTYTNEDDIILDNCMGSGSTGVACKKLGRNFIGIEIDETCFNKAKERLNNVTKISQNLLF